MQKNDLINDFILQTRLYKKCDFLKSLKIQGLLCKDDENFNKLINCFYFYILMNSDNDYSKVEKVIDSNALLVQNYRNFLYLIFNRIECAKYMNFCLDDTLFTSENNFRNYSKSIVHCIYSSINDVKKVALYGNSNICVCLPCQFQIFDCSREDNYKEVYSYFNDNILNFYYYDSSIKEYVSISSFINRNELIYMYNSYIASRNESDNSLCKSFLSKIFNNSKTVNRDLTQYGYYPIVYKKYEEFVKTRGELKIEIS